MRPDIKDKKEIRTVITRRPKDVLVQQYATVKSPSKG